MQYTLLLSFAFAALATALPIDTCPEEYTKESLITADALKKIAPKSETCAGAKFPEECSTADDAVAPLNAAFAQYEITNPWEITAVLSLIIFETEGFKFAKNHFPGRPGQGTRNMQMWNYNWEYVLSITASDDVALSTAVGNQDKAAISADPDAVSDDIKNKVLDLLLQEPEAAWSSGAWYLKTHCAEARPTIQKGGAAALSAYLACVKTPPAELRMTSFQDTAAALGLTM